MEALSLSLILPTGKMQFTPGKDLSHLASKVVGSADGPKGMRRSNCTGMTAKGRESGTQGGHTAYTTVCQIIIRG